MQDVLEKAKAHFREQLDGDLKSFHVPEWDITIYWKPLNLKQQNKIYRYIREGSLEALVETLIVRARDQAGNLLYRPANKTELMTMVDPGVINRIVEAMGEDGDFDGEEIEKNS